MRRAAVLLMTLAALAGCGPAGREAPAARGFAPAPATTTLALRNWQAAGAPRAAILALHGFGDAGELAFGGAARYWASRGIVVYAPDQRGFGANPSRRRWPGPEVLVADAVTLSRRVRAAHPDLPLVVIGHSMGGGVALAAAAQGLEADALVLAGPAVAGGDAVNPGLRALALAAVAVVPERRWTGEGVVSIQPTDNPAAIAAALADPLHFGDPSSRELWGLVRVMDQAAAAAPAVTLPTLTLMGAHDQVLRPRDVRAVHATIPGALAFRLYPEGWHWLFRDLHAELVWREVADFVLSPVERRGPAPRG